MMSIRNASVISGLSYSLVRDILHKDLNFRPCKPRSVQELFPEDMDRRVEFAETMLEMSERRPDLFSKIIWSDEAVFQPAASSIGITATTGQNSHPISSSKSHNIDLA